MTVVEIPVPTVVETEVTTADILTRAADLLEKFGWVQGVLFGAEERQLQVSGNIWERARRAKNFCAMGAIYRAASDLGTSLDSARKAELAVQDLIKDPRLGGLAIWNDARGRTKGEVVALLRLTSSANRD